MGICPRGFKQDYDTVPLATAGKNMLSSGFMGTQVRRWLLAHEMVSEGMFGIFKVAWEWELNRCFLRGGGGESIINNSANIHYVPGLAS